MSKSIKSASKSNVTFKLPPNRASLREHVRQHMDIGGVTRPTTFCFHPKLNTYKVQVLGIGGYIVYIAHDDNAKKGEQWAASLCKKVDKRTYTPEGKIIRAGSPKEAFLKLVPTLEEFVESVFGAEEEESDE